jgi:site-specific recombinase XerD
MVMRLLPVLGKKPRSYNAHLIRMAIVTETKRASVTYVKTMTTALRGYLRFLGAQGLCRPGLDHAVPTVPQWRLSALPRYIPASDVERLIATCDATTPVGIRNRAILLLLARLGYGLATFSLFVSTISIGNRQRCRFAVRGGARQNYHCHKMQVTPC